MVEAKIRIPNAQFEEIHLRTQRLVKELKDPSTLGNSLGDYWYASAVETADIISGHLELDPFEASLFRLSFARRLALEKTGDGERPLDREQRFMDEVRQNVQQTQMGRDLDVNRINRWLFAARDEGSNMASWLILDNVSATFLTHQIERAASRINDARPGLSLTPLPEGTLRGI